MSTRLEGNVYVTGDLQSKTMTIPTGAVGKDAVAAGAGLEATKLQHEHRSSYAQESATTVADEARVLHVVRGAIGLTIAFEAGAVVPCVGDAVCTVDLLKNGVSILTAAISLSVAEAAYDVVAGTINTAALVDGDVLEVVIDGTIGTGTLPKGVFAALSVYEDAQ